MIDVERPSLLGVSATHYTHELGGIRKQVERAMGKSCQQYASVDSASDPTSRFQP